MEWLIGAVSGLVGGNAAGAASKKNSLGPLLNSVTGAAGGALGGFAGDALLQNLLGTVSSGQFDLGALGGQIAGGGLVGALVTLVIGWIKNKLGKR